MTGRLGGRSNVAHQAAPVAVLAPMGLGEVGTPCLCGQGPITYSGNPITDTFGASPLPVIVTTCDDVTDMRVQLTIGAIDNTSWNEFVLVARISVSGYYYIWYWRPESGAVSPYNTFSPELLCHRPSLGDLVLAGGYPATHAAPIAGDVLELSVIGTTITGKFNGGVVYSVTDSTYTGHGNMGIHPDITVSGGDGWTASLVTEDFCP